MKLQFKDSIRVFWYITYTNYASVHIIEVQCEEWGNINITISENKDHEDDELSTNQIMMLIADAFCKIGLRFANGTSNAHQVNKFNWEK
jgi:hypothetical protein